MDRCMQSKIKLSYDQTQSALESHGIVSTVSRKNLSNRKRKMGNLITPSSHNWSLFIFLIHRAFWLPKCCFCEVARVWSDSVIAIVRRLWYCILCHYLFLILRLWDLNVVLCSASNLARPPNQERKGFTTLVRNSVLFSAVVFVFFIDSCSECVCCLCLVRVNHFVCVLLFLCFLSVCSVCSPVTFGLLFVGALFVFVTDIQSHATQTTSRVCNNTHALIRKYNLMMCRRCFRERAKDLGWKKVCPVCSCCVLFGASCFLYCLCGCLFVGLFSLLFVVFLFVSLCNGAVWCWLPCLLSFRVFFLSACLLCCVLWRFCACVCFCVRLCPCLVRSCLFC